MNKLAIGDADGLIALADEKDVNHIKAKKTSEWLIKHGFHIVFPNTTLLETITALKRGKNLPEKAHLINKQYQAGVFSTEFIDEKIQLAASKRFEQTVSKKNTIFDSVVCEVAIELGADYIFSFDKWYSKQGFSLAPEK